MTKLTQEELQSIQEIKQRRKAITEELGSIGLIKLQLKTRQQQLEAFYVKTNEIEGELAKTLEVKYGRANIDTETGEVTPIEE